MVKKFYKSVSFISIIITIVLFVPGFVSAQLNFGSNFKALITSILNVIRVLIPILFALAFLVFFWGLSKFILHSGNEAEVKNGKNYMLWGLLALFLLVTSLAIITFLMNELGFPAVSPLLPE